MSQHLTEHDELVSDGLLASWLSNRSSMSLTSLRPWKCVKNDYSAESYRLRQPSGLCRSGDPSRGAKSDRID